ncbi:MAG: SDR family oxidoreductase [Gammaproteobacteria bacterium]|nr:SDR family oxidoreductase [Gammaproteobacteria bacterium]
MKEFSGKLAVITGGGTGMGRELARALVAQGCHVALCDLSSENMAETRALCEAQATQGTRVTTFEADVSDEAQMQAFREAVHREHDLSHINLLFNNAGIAGGGSFINDDRTEWERTFNVCWLGVYGTTRVFMPALLASEEGHIVNTSSVNGFWASLGPTSSHTAYSAAKFAVKGFSEALVNDLRNNAPHVGVSVVMPGHVGTSIVANTRKLQGKADALAMPAEEVATTREWLRRRQLPVDAMSDDEVRQAVHQFGVQFHDNALTSAEDAAQIILDGVRESRWRILVGPDAHVLDTLVREAPEDAYEPSFMEVLRAKTQWGLGN